MATLIPVDGPPRFIEPANGKAFTLPELHALVGGYIEVVRTRYVVPSTTLGHGIEPAHRMADNEDLLMVVNEEGHRLNLPVNAFATEMAMLGYLSVPPSNVILGAAVVCTREELGEREHEEEA